MKHTFTVIDSPIGCITLVAGDNKPCGLYLEGQRHWPEDSGSWIRDNGSHFDEVREWLGNYFSGENDMPYPEFTFAQGTDFQKKVWRSLLGIPHGKTVSYGTLARRIGAPKAVRALGAAVGRNPLSIIVPCHRVLGVNGSLTGYAGGLGRKLWLLQHEGVMLQGGIILEGLEIASTI